MTTTSRALVLAAAFGLGGCFLYPTTSSKCGSQSDCTGTDVCVGGACQACASAGGSVCGAACSFTQTDVANCGVCGTACPSGEGCQGGACVAACQGTSSLCTVNGKPTCVELQSDSLNCGVCGTACAAGQTCAAGACGETCATGFTQCNLDAGAYCANLDQDFNNCGVCGLQCSGGLHCDGTGSCTGTCATGFTPCHEDAGTVCADTDTDTGNCGTCGTLCPAGGSCKTGSCACPTGETTCGTGPAASCAATGSDPKNCGTCGNSCATGFGCTAGKCEGCAAGYGACTFDGGTTCVDTAGDPSNCGSCGKVCATGESCAAGVCLGCATGYRACTADGGAYCADSQTDPANCGSCGHACGGTTPCVAGVCGAAGCGSGPACSPGLTCNSQGSCVAPTVLAAGQGTPTLIAVDSSTDKVAFSTSSGVASVATAGGAVSSVPLTLAASALAVVPGVFFVVDTGGNLFGLTGATLSTIYPPDGGVALGAPGGLAANVTDAFVAAAGSIVEVPGTCPASCTTTNVYDSLTAPVGLVLFGSSLAWTVGTGTALDIGLVTADGGVAPIAATLPTGSTPLGVTAADATSVYVAAAGNAVLQFSAAGAVTGTWTAPAPVVALASDGTHLLGLSHPASGGDVLWLVTESAGKTPVVVYGGFTAAAGGLAVSGGAAFWTDAVANGTVQSIVY